MNLEEAKSLCDTIDINDGSQRAEAMLILRNALEQTESVLRFRDARLRELEPLADIEFDIGGWTIHIQPLDACINWYRSYR